MSPEPRICIFHKNLPDMLAKITSLVGARGMNIENMVNSSKKHSAVAYTMLEVNSVPDQALLDAVSKINGVIRVRVVHAD